MEKATLPQQQLIGLIAMPAHGACQNTLTTTCVCHQTTTQASNDTQTLLSWPADCPTHNDSTLASGPSLIHSLLCASSTGGMLPRRSGSRHPFHSGRVPKRRTKSLKYVK